MAVLFSRNPSNGNWKTVDGWREIERNWPVVDYSDITLLAFIVLLVMVCAGWLIITRRAAKRKPTIHMMTLAEREDPNRSYLTRRR